MTLSTESVAGVPAGHVVQFYADDVELLDGVGEYLAGGAAAGDVVIVIATEAHRAAFEACLSERGIDPGLLRAAGTLVCLDAEATLSEFLVDDRPSPARFDEVVGGLVRRAIATGRPVRAYGEMVARLWDEGNVGAALELEALWNDLGRAVDFSLYCAYRAASLDGDAEGGMADVCKLHAGVVTPTAPRRASRTLPGTEASVAAARAFTRQMLESWNCLDWAEDVGIVVAELTANVIRHAGTDFTIELEFGNGRIHVEVHDGSDALPSARDAGLWEGSGRGLRIVATLSDRWGTSSDSTGKSVWADFGGRTT